MSEITESEAGRFSVFLYAAIWVFGVVGAAYYFIPTLEDFSKQIHDTLSGTVSVPLSVVRYGLYAIIGATFVHVSLVYLSMHEMDSRPRDWRLEFPNWASTRLEYCVRFFILIALFSIADKIWPVLQKLAAIFHLDLGLAMTSGNIVLCGEPLWVFPLSCAGLFFVLLFWDFLGVWRKDEHTNRLVDVPKHLVTLIVRMNSDARAAFLRSDLFGFLFWGYITAFVMGFKATWGIYPFLLISPASYILNNGWRGFRYLVLDGRRIVVPPQPTAALS